MKNWLGQQERQTNILKKHVATIHCSNTLTLLQRKISNALLYHAYNDLIQKDEHEIGVSTLCKIIGYSGHNYGAIKTAIKGLISTILEWNVLADETQTEEEWNASTILASVKIKGSVCTYAYSKQLIRLIFSPSVYGRVNMMVQARFKSTYGLALYENCNRYAGLPQTAWFDVLVFRKLMGVPDNQYLIFRDLKRRVLDKAIEEVNAYSHLHVKHELKKQGREVKKIRFHLSNQNLNSQNENLLVDPKSNEHHCKDKLIRLLVEEWGININQIKSWLEKYGVDEINEKINYVKSTNAYKSNKIAKRGSYLSTALEQNFQENAKIDKSPYIDQELKRKIKAYASKYQSYVEQELIDFVEKLDSVRSNEIIQNFIAKYAKETGGNIVIKAYQEGGLNCVKDIFLMFVKHQFPELLSNIPDIKEFIRKIEEII